MTKIIDVKFEEIPEPNAFELVEFVENAERRCPVVLLLDKSGSMHGEPLQEMNRGAVEFVNAIREDALAAKRVELCIVSFGPVTVEQEFTTVDNIEFTELQASGLTPIGEAIEKATFLLNERKRKYKAAGIDYYKPWVVIITDGGPTGPWTDAVKGLQEMEAENGCTVFSIGVGGADMDFLNKVSENRDAIKLKGVSFREFFLWLSNSVGAVSASRPGEKVSLPSVSGWADVDV